MLRSGLGAPAQDWRADGTAVIGGRSWISSALVAVLCTLAIRRRTSERAQLELAARQNAGLLDPKILAIGLQVGRAVGWHRLLSVATAGALIAGLAKELRHREAQDQAPAE